MRNRFALIFALIMAVCLAGADDGLLGGRGGSNGGSSGGSGGGEKPPIRTEPPPERVRPPIRTDDRYEDDSWRFPDRSRGPVRNEGPIFPNREGRTGFSRYGTNSNRFSDFPVTLTPIPRFGNEVARQVLGEPTAERVYEINYRDGYYYYDPRWRDDSFYYPYYRFGYTPDSVPSPWYSYPHLPGYLNWSRITLYPSTFRWNDGSSYRWQEPREFGGSRFNNDRDRYSELDYAVADIREAFRLKRINEMGSLISESASVLVEVHGEWSYRVNPDDFYDMLRDTIEATNTEDYRIEDVKRVSGGAVIHARHTFFDAWQRRQTRYHAYELRDDRRGFQIERFRVDERPIHRW